MDAHAIEWLNLVFRWIHVIAGIAWIGASFYFNWLENALNRAQQRPGIAGSLWAIHGGGFYYVEKYQLAPNEIPKKLHWFKWEAYLTWLSGFLLLITVYYAQAQLFLVKLEQPLLGTAGSIFLSLALLVGTWIAYDLLCRSQLGTNNAAIGAMGLIFVGVMAWFLPSVYQTRASYMQIGAMLGTCMAANVYRVIIPSQKALVSAAISGSTLDPNLGKRAAQRSLHNNYMTLPVLFVMISNHFPSTYGYSAPWIMLLGLFIAGVMVRHWFNLKGKGHYNLWLPPASIVVLIALAIVSHPKPQVAAEHAPLVTFSSVKGIMERRCNSCHSEKPTDDIFTLAPAGVTFDRPEQIKNFAARIYVRAVEQKTMPLGNKTQMSDDERDVIGTWIQQGAVVNP